MTDTTKPRKARVRKTATKNPANTANDISEAVEIALDVGTKAFAIGQALGEKLATIEQTLNSDHGISIVDLLSDVARQFHGIKF